MFIHSFAALICFSYDAFLFNLRCQTCYWGNVCTKEAFTFTSVVFLCRMVLPVWSRDLVSASEDSRSCTFSCDGAAIHVLCVSGSLYLSVFVRPPRHTISRVSSPNYIPDERKDSWCAYVPLTSVLLRLYGNWLMRKGVAVFIRTHSVLRFRGKSFFVSLLAHLSKNPSTCDRIHFAQFCMLCFVKLCWIWSLFSLFLSFLDNNCASITQLSFILYKLH